MAVAIGDEVIAVGAPTEDSDGSSPANNGVSASGAAYVFRRSGTTWSGPEYLKAPTPTVSSQFGRSLALSAGLLLLLTLLLYFLGGFASRPRA